MGNLLLQPRLVSCSRSELGEAFGLAWITATSQPVRVFHPTPQLMLRTACKVSPSVAIWPSGGSGGRGARGCRACLTREAP